MRAKATELNALENGNTAEGHDLCDILEVRAQIDVLKRFYRLMANEDYKG